jgi:uncharacterized protein YfeS
MRLEAMTKTYDSFGGHPLMSLAMDFLLGEAPDVGRAISGIGITFHFPHHGPPRSTLEDLHASFNAYRARLPKIVYRRKQSQVEIDVASDLLDAGTLRDAHGMPVALFRQAVAEVAIALDLLGRRLSAKDDFDLAGFLAFRDGQLSKLPSTQEALEAFQQESERRWRIRQASASPWDALDIDWGKYHPDARKILDDPFYWECANDFAPHGNDTGADLLEDYRKWSRRNAGGDPIAFHRRLLARWGVSMEPQTPADRTMHDEAAIALAFAELKLLGKCRPAVAALARAAVCSQRREATNAVDWPHRSERLKSLDAIEAGIPMP